ncbi:hypothetical protein D3P08_09020 [Paenibacillus nanensis]|uniref:Uncharacterized protein n=1 Tax=Paenibacillus nanensis TaxID=393251 RepID=A0A3A1UYH1_9BACL|nr:hypothetical protein [Paenibacillus nanensis]RIX53568.1 hypothetical protein D3P08_09020 [Paenibacillus nanensis]
MKMMKRVVGLTLLMALLAFPASAFASSYSTYSGNQNKGFFSSIFSFFGGSSKDKNDYSKYSNNYGSSYGYGGSHGGSNGGHYGGGHNNHNNDKGGFWDWFDKDWWDKDWWDDYCWWDDYKDDSWKLWEKYFCY